MLIFIKNLSKKTKINNFGGKMKIIGVIFWATKTLIYNTIIVYFNIYLAVCGHLLIVFLLFMSLFLDLVVSFERAKSVQGNMKKDYRH